jgi:hypothetical protein
VQRHKLEEVFVVTKSSNESTTPMTVGGK